MAWWPFGLYRVVGESMSPTFRHGDVLLGVRWYRVAPRQIVVARTDKLVIKRVDQISADGIWLLGDNSLASTDSRNYGWVPRSAIIAHIWFRVARS
jgi:nickel-type superoxide dismutase maturation protease